MLQPDVQINDATGIASGLGLEKIFTEPECSPSAQFHLEAHEILTILGLDKEIVSRDYT